MVLNNGAVIIFVISWSVMNNESSYPLLVIRYDAILAWKFKSHFGKYQFSGKEPYLTNTFLQCTLFSILLLPLYMPKLIKTTIFLNFRPVLKKEIQIWHIGTLKIDGIK